MEQPARWLSEVSSVTPSARSTCFSTWLLHCKIAPTDIFIPGKATRILAMHHLSFVDDKCLLGNPQAEMHVLLGEQDSGAARSEFPQYLADRGDHDRG